MRTIEVTNRSMHLSQLLAKAQRENLILRSPTGAEFILAQINDFDREIELQRQNPSLMVLLDRRGRQPATKSASEVRKRLRLSKG
jgi:hypothetical protein